MSERERVALVEREGRAKLENLCPTKIKRALREFIMYFRAMQITWCRFKGPPEFFKLILWPFSIAQGEAIKGANATIARNSFLRLI